MFWALTPDGQNYEVIADYVTSTRRFALRKTRRDDKTFCSESRSFFIPASGDGV